MIGGLQEIEDWLVIQSGKPAGSGKIDPDLNLFESGVLSSLQVMELVVMIEQASGEQVDRLSIGPGDLSTINQIGKRFFGLTPADSETPHVGG
jgi:acyl carrier protein